MKPITTQAGRYAPSSRVFDKTKLADQLESLPSSTDAPPNTTDRFGLALAALSQDQDTCTLLEVDQLISRTAPAFELARAITQSLLGDMPANLHERRALADPEANLGAQLRSLRRLLEQIPPGESATRALGE